MKGILTATVLMALVGCVACGKDPQTTPTIINIVNNNTNTNNNGQSGVGANEPTSRGAVTSDTKSVTVNGMKDGEVCPSGTTPANENKKVRVGCSLAVTVNPRNSAGTVILDEHAPAVDYFVLAFGSDVVTFSQSSSNSYNGSVKVNAAGKFAFIASVVGVSSGLQEFEAVK